MKFFVRVEGDAQEIGLTSESLNVAIESRLRAALSANMPETPAPRGISVGRGGEDR